MKQIELDKLIPNHPTRKRIYEKFHNLITKYINVLFHYWSINVKI